MDDCLNLHDLLLVFRAHEEGTKILDANERSVCGNARNRDLTFDMSGGPKGAKQPLARPLDGGVRPRL